MDPLHNIQRGTLFPVILKGGADGIRSRIVLLAWLLHISAGCNGVSNICSLDDPTPEQVASGGGAHTFFGQQGRLLLASPRDPLRYNIHRWKNGRESGLRVDTPKGHMDITSARSAHQLMNVLSLCVVLSPHKVSTLGISCCNSVHMSDVPDLMQIHGASQGGRV